MSSTICTSTINMDNDEAYKFSEAPEEYLSQRFSSSSSQPKSFYKKFTRMLKKIALFSCLVLSITYILSFFSTPPPPPPRQPICSEKSLLVIPAIDALKNTSSHFQSLYLEPTTPILRSHMRNLTSSLNTVIINTQSWIEDTVPSLQGLLPIIDTQQAIREREQEQKGIRSWFQKDTSRESSQTENQLETLHQTIYSRFNTNLDIIKDFKLLLKDLNVMKDELATHHSDLKKQLFHENRKWFWRTDYEKLARLEVEIQLTNRIRGFCGIANQLMGDANVFIRLGRILEQLNGMTKEAREMHRHDNAYVNWKAMRELVERFRLVALSNTQIMKDKAKEMEDQIQILKTLREGGREGEHSDGEDKQRYKSASSSAGVGDQSNRGKSAAGDGSGPGKSTDQAEQSSASKRWWQWWGSNRDAEKSRRGGSDSFDGQYTRQGHIYNQQRRWLSTLFDCSANISRDIVNKWVVHKWSETAGKLLDFVVLVAKRVVKGWVMSKAKGWGINLEEEGLGNANGM